MTVSLPHAERFADADSWTVLRALAGAAPPPELDAAAEEMDRAGDLGLTISVSEVLLRRHAEGIWGRWFGATGEFYVVTTAMDGSGQPFDYRTRFFQGLRRDDRLPLGDGGMLVSYMTNPKWFIDVHMLVMESDSDLRDLGAILAAAREQARLEEMLDEARDVVAFDPGLVRRVVGGVDLFLGALTHLLRENGDDHVATIHDFYLRHQAFGKGRHPATGLRSFGGVDAAYEIQLTPL